MITDNIDDYGFIEAFYHESDHFQIDIHLHDMYEIYCAVSDNIKYYIEGHSYMLSAGDIIITNEKEIHRPIIVDDQPCKRQYIKFVPYGFHTYFDNNYNPLSIFENRTLGTLNLIPSNNLHHEKIQEIFSQIIFLTKEKSPANQLMIKSLMLQLFIFLHEAHHESYHAPLPSKDFDSRIEQTLHLLNDQYRSQITLNQISQELLIDKYYLAQLFKKNTGFTIMEYVQSKRIQHAKALISSGKPIMEVSRLSGFDDYSNFYKTFKKITGVSPKVYKSSVYSSSHMLSTKH